MQAQDWTRPGPPRRFRGDAAQPRRRADGPGRALAGRGRRGGGRGRRACGGPDRRLRRRDVGSRRGEDARVCSEGWVSRVAYDGVPALVMPHSKPSAVRSEDADRALGGRRRNRAHNLVLLCRRNLTFVHEYMGIGSSGRPRGMHARCGRWRARCRSRQPTRMSKVGVHAQSGRLGEVRAHAPIDLPRSWRCAVALRA